MHDFSAIENGLLRLKCAKMIPALETPCDTSSAVKNRQRMAICPLCQPIDFSHSHPPRKINRIPRMNSRNSLDRSFAFNKLKTTPTPNKNGSYGIKGGFVCHRSWSSYVMKVGLCSTFSVKVPLFQGIFTPCDPSFYGIFWGHIFY